jgi:hypothetical protein
VSALRAQTCNGVGASRLHSLDERLAFSCAALTGQILPPLPERQRSQVESPAPFSFGSILFPTLFPTLEKIKLGGNRHQQSSTVNGNDFSVFYYEKMY